jgi:hypothetical protein
VAKKSAATTSWMDWTGGGEIIIGTEEGVNKIEK